MKFHKIDLEHWGRSKTFKHYMQDIPCTYSMCVNIDIQRLLTVLKIADIKFFPTFLYGLSQIVNAHPEFRMCWTEERKLGYYETSYPCYTVFDQTGDSFVEIWSKYDREFSSFYATYLENMQTYGPKAKVKLEQPSANNLFNVSCIPWTSFTGFNLNLQAGYEYLAPIFTLGKYYQDQDKVLLPVAIQVHHAVCDGFHIARFVNELQEWADTFSI